MSNENVGLRKRNPRSLQCGALYKLALPPHPIQNLGPHTPKVHITS